MTSRGHISLPSFALLDVDNGVEEVGFTVLTSEVLRHLVSVLAIHIREHQAYLIHTYSTYDLIMIGEMCLAVLAAIDLLGVEIYVVGEAHL